MAQSSQDILTSAFGDDFNPRAYLATYYPAEVQAEKLLEALHSLDVKYHAGQPTDIKYLLKSTGIPSELIENLLILDFQRVIARRLLAEYPRGDITTVDVGGGPTAYQHIAMSLAANKIIHSEFLERNREEVDRWLRNEHGAYDWSGYFTIIRLMLLKDAEYQAVLMSHLAASDPAIRAHAQLVDALLRNPDLEAYKTKVRHCVSGNVIFGDIFEQNLGNPMELCGLADVVTSNFAVESATGDMAQWEKGMRNIAALVKVGGFLAVAAIRNAGWYLVGDKKVPAVQIDESAIANFCAAERFTIVETRVLTGSNQDKHGYDGVVFALAKKE